MNTDHAFYIPIPILIIFVLQFFVPYMQNFKCIDLWIVPHHFTCIGLFLLSYILFGVLMWVSNDGIDNIKSKNEIFAYAWVLTFLNFLWIYYFKRSKEKALVSLFLSLLFGYFLYNAIFLSELSHNTETLYINLMAIYMVWIGFMITILIESSPGFIKTKRRKHLPRYQT